MTGLVFNRYEKKYMLSEIQYNKLFKRLQDYCILDEHGKYTVCNIYYDTDDYELVRTSLDKPIYKEKLRLRSYGIPTKDTPVFLEIKKKYKKLVNKRRIILPLENAYNYLDNKIEPANESVQILNEINYFINHYPLSAKVYLAYDRIAMAGKEDSSFRVTFDTNVRYRDYDIRLEKGDYGKNILPDNVYLMEIKINGSIPLWFTHILTELDIYPASFSKYGKVYQTALSKNEHILVKQLTA